MGVILFAWVISISLFFIIISPYIKLDGAPFNNEININDISLEFILKIG
jgi:hypothetical protein